MRVALGIVSVIILLAVYGEGNDVVLFKSVHFPKSQKVLPVEVGRYKRGFGDTDTGNRATETAPPTTVSPPLTPPDGTTATTTSKSNTTATAATTTVTAGTTKTAATTKQTVSSTPTGGNVTDSTKETTTSAGHVISKTLTYISFIIIIAEHILFQ
ncbi:uncharacterized protein LOC132744474 isoform X1 [Ruditapes philippinarum]|uniref:uncharacterized protein LOC132744474 isoform X1 n=1 Tax=Ruditapes philippinarum TaxID=129788 RepID=UPI00295B74A8|nr:uncharacterized protein LOC132744474 isoform X1 [Ruditapes philippinarum]